MLFRYIPWVWRFVSYMLSGCCVLIKLETGLESLICLTAYMESVCIWTETDWNIVLIYACGCKHMNPANVLSGCLSILSYMMLLPYSASLKVSGACISVCLKCQTQYPTPLKVSFACIHGDKKWCLQ